MYFPKTNMKLLNKYMAIFFNFSPISSHLHRLQAENCDSNSRLVVDEDDNVKSGLKGSRGDQINVIENETSVQTQYSPMFGPKLST